MNKSFSEFAPMLSSAESIHQIVSFIERLGILAGMRETGSALAIFCCGDVHVMRGAKELSLGPAHHFQIVEREFSTGFKKRIEAQKRCGTVISMRIDRPVCNYQIRLFR